MAVTIKDVAIRAGLSYTSVSRAMNDKPGVSRENRERILEIAKAMGYTPNNLARGLVNKRTSTIGLIIPDIINPFFPEIARGIDDAAEELGYTLTLCNSGWDLEKERRYIDLLAERKIDGLIILPVCDGSIQIVTERFGQDFPVVFLSEFPAQGQGSVSIGVDNHKGAALVVDHFARQGRSRIAFIGGRQGLTGVDARLEGFLDAMRQADIPVDQDLVVRKGFGFESGRTAIREILAAGDLPDAVFAENDDIALGVLQGLNEASIDVPGTTAVAGFDDIPTASLYGIELTTVRQPKYQLGQMAFTYLIRQILQDLGSEGRTILLEPELVVRKTG